MKEIIGKKLGMTRVFRPDGESIPVTVIEAGPCKIVQVKTEEKEGYSAYQVGFGERKKNRTNKPLAGHFEKAKLEPMQVLKEVRVDGDPLEVGTDLKVDLFKAGEKVDVSGVTRGLGFAGAMKRHNFQGANKTHGQSDRWRAPGSIGQSSYPSRVFKGQRMPGRMGNEKFTVLNLEVVQIIPDENLMLVRGAVPGFKGSMVKVRSTNRGR